MKPAPQKPSLFSALLAPLTGGDQVLQEKARLEAFLNAFPGEYCGFHEDGSVAYSDGFCALLGVKTVGRIEDVQAALPAGDAAALEGQYTRLEQDGKPFSLRVQPEGGTKILRLRGSAGAAIDGSDKFRIVWAEDISGEEDALSALRRGKESAERDFNLMQGALETMPVPAWLRDATGDLGWVNKAYGHMLGCLPHDATESQIEIMLSPKSKTRTPREMAGDATREGKAQSTQCAVIVGGKRRWMEIREIPLPGTHRTLGLALDMTREEELLTELDRHAGANKTLLEQLRSAIAIFGADQSLEFFNTAYAAQWGLEEQWLNTKPRFGDILEKLREHRRLPEQTDFRKYKQGWVDMFTRLIDPHEEMLYLPDGSAVRVLVVPHPMGGLMMTFEDVTSRLELESSYNTLIAVQKETLDNLAEGVVVYGGDGRVKLWNPSFAALWNLAPEALEGGPHINKIAGTMAALFPEDAREDMKKSFVSQGLDRTENEGRHLREDGIHLRYATMPLPDGGVMVSYYDITDSARVEHALREKNAALEAAEQLKTDFLANVSYQFRTPLNAIMGFAEILSNQYFGPLNDRQREYASGIFESGERLTTLVDDILDLSTIEAGYLELDKQHVAVQPLLQGLHDLTVDWARKRNLSVKLSCPPSVGSLNIDERRMKQALLNLIRNAITFTPEGGKIEIAARREGDVTIFSITDTGVGIPAEDLTRIFQPFERTVAGRNAGQAGAGLGLALVKNIVELHGGRIKIDSVENRGTIVTVTL